MSKSIVTEYQEICFFCGRQAEGEHHLIFGTAGRELSEKDGLKVPTCNNCHYMGEPLNRVHGNPMAEKLSKMLGQAVWERNWILKDAVHDPDGEEEAQVLESRIASIIGIRKMMKKARKIGEEKICKSGRGTVRDCAKDVENLQQSQVQ